MGSLLLNFSTFGRPEALLTSTDSDILDLCAQNLPPPRRYSPFPAEARDCGFELPHKG